MTYDLTGAPTPPPLRGKGTLITGVVLLLLGLLLVIIGIVATATAASGLIGQIGSPQTAPTAQQTPTPTSSAVPAPMVAPSVAPSVVFHARKSPAR